MRKASLSRHGQPIPPSARNDRRGFYLFALAVVVRLLYLAEASDAPTFNTPVLDSSAYVLRATEILAGKGWTADLFWQPVFYPVFLAGLLGVSGSSLLFAKIVQAVIGGVTCFLVWRLGVRLFDRKVAWIAGLVVAFYGPLIFLEGEHLAEGLAAFWSVALLLLFLNAEKNATFRGCLALGLCGALAVLTRPTFLPFLAGGFLWLLFSSVRKDPSRVPRLALVLGGFLVVGIPASVLSQRATGMFAMTPHSGGLNFYIGNSPRMAEMLTIRPGWKWARLVSEPLALEARSYKDKQAFFYDKVQRYASEEPLGFLRGLGDKTLRLVSGREIPRNESLYAYHPWSLVQTVLSWKAGWFGFPFGLLLPLAAAGLWIGRRRLSWVFWFLVSYGGAIVLVFVTGRYRVPMIPILAVPAAVALAHAGALFRRRREMVVPAILFAIALLLSLHGEFPEEKLDYRAELYYLLGEAREQKQDFAGAAAWHRRAIEVDDGFAEAHARLGDDLLIQGTTDEAVRHLERAVSLEPDNVTALHRLGLLASRRRDFDTAAERYFVAVDGNPTNARLRNSLAFCLESLGRREEALVQFREALRLDPEDASARVNFATVLVRSGDPREAARVLEEGLTTSPNETGLLKGLASILAGYDESEGGDPLRAIGVAERAAALSPNNPAILDIVAMAYASGGRFPEAIGSAERAIAIARATGNGPLAEDIGRRLVLYREGQPYRHAMARGSQ